MSRDIRHIRFLELDPRMKLLLVVVFASATFSAPNLLALIWMYLLVVVLYLARGLWLGAKKTAMLFAVFLLINLILSFVPQSKFAAGVGMILFMLERVVVFFVMGAWMGSKLRVSDFVTAMQNMHVPKGGTIALAVAFRYIPTVQDEFRFIKNTMMLRGIGLTVRNVLLHPVKTCEYAIVPLIIRSMTIVFGQFTGRIDDILHFPDDGKGDGGDVQVVDAPVAVAQKGAGTAIHCTDHALLRFLLEPAVDIIGQQFRILSEHPPVVLPGDLQIIANLLMGCTLDVQGIDQLTAVRIPQVEHGLTVPHLHDKAPGVHQVVLFGLALAHDLDGHLLNCPSGFHCISTLLSMVTRPRKRSWPLRSQPGLPAPEPSPAAASRPWPGSC